MHADVFSAVGAHSPALTLNLAPPVYDPFYLLDRPDVATLRIYLDAGDVDWARTGTERLHETLAQRGFDHVFETNPGGHADELWSTNIPDYLAFYTASWWFTNTTD